MKTRSLFLIASLVAVAGCTVAAGNEPPPRETLGSAKQGYGGGDGDPAGKNGKSGACAFNVETLKLYHALADIALKDVDSLDYSQLDPDCHREVLENVFECALDYEDKVSITDPANTTGYDTYYGWWGLAPKWQEEPLTTEERRWVTGCMMQRLNFFGIEMPILLEGAHPQINYHTVYDTKYPFDESTVWGDIFGYEKGGPSPKIYVCSDTDLDALCPVTSPNPPGWWLDLRICDLSNLCGLVFMGSCSQVCVPNTSTGYPLCRDDNGVFWVETVHVQMLPHDSCELPEDPEASVQAVPWTGLHGSSSPGVSP